MAAFLVAVAQCCGTGAAVFIVDRFGRKILLILSNVFMALPLAALGTYFYLDENRIFCENGTQLFLDQNVCTFFLIVIIYKSYHKIIFFASDLGFGTSPMARSFETIHQIS